MTKAELIAEREKLNADYAKLADAPYDQQIIVYKKITAMNDKIKHFPTLKLISEAGDILAVFAVAPDAHSYLMGTHAKTYRDTLDRYRAEMGPEGFRKGFVENWNKYSQTLKIETMADDVPEFLVQKTWDYYGCSNA